MGFRGPAPSPTGRRAAPVCPKPAGAVSSARASLIISHQKAPLYPQAGFRIYKRSPAIGRTVTIMWREWCFSFDTGNCMDPVGTGVAGTLHFEPGRRIPWKLDLACRVETPDVYGRRYLASGFRGRLRSARLDLGQAKARHQEGPWILSGRRPTSNARGPARVKRLPESRSLLRPTLEAVSEVSSSIAST